MNTFSIDLDLDKQGPLQVVRVRQGDRNGTTIAATIYDHGQPLTGSFNTRVVLATPGGETYYRKVGTFANGVATVTIDETGAATISGQSFGYFQLLQGTTVIASTESFVLQVLPDALADASVAEPYDEAIQQAIDELQEATEAIPGQVQAEVEAQLAAHPEWTTTVQDGSITYPKLASSLKQRLGNTLHRLVTAPVVTASDAYAAPPVALVVDGKSVQDGTPTPDAPVAIQSVESVGLAAAGRNLLPNFLGNTYPSSTTVYGVTLTNNGDGTFSMSGTGEGRHDSFSKVVNWSLPAGRYVLSGCPAGGGATTYLLCIRIAREAGGNFYVNDQGSGASFTINDGDVVTRIYINISDGVNMDGKVFAPQIELGSTATPYTPYVGSTTAIPLDGHALRSLPDGTHDELRVDSDGVVTLVQRVGSVDLGTLTWTAQSNVSNIYAAVIATMQPTTTTASRLTGLACARYSLDTIPGVNDDMGDKTMKRVNQAVYIKDISYADPAAFKAAMSGVMLHYILATPVEIPLGTVALPSMPAPDLTAWASCTPATEIELDYERDVSLVIAALEAQIAEIATA